MQKNILNIFKSIKGSYNLIDLAKKPKGKDLPRSRASFKEEYKILKLYKEGSIRTSDAIIKLAALNNTDESKAWQIIKNFDNNNIVPMKLE